MGTGPYRFQAWQKGQFVDLVRNENYWGEKPSIPQVRFIPVPEGTTRVALVETGQAHVAVRIHSSRHPPAPGQSGGGGGAHPQPPDDLHLLQHPTPAL